MLENVRNEQRLIQFGRALLSSLERPWLLLATSVQRNLLRVPHSWSVQCWWNVQVSRWIWVRHVLVHIHIVETFFFTLYSSWWAAESTRTGLKDGCAARPASWPRGLNWKTRLFILLAWLGELLDLWQPLSLPETFLFRDPWPASYSQSHRSWMSSYIHVVRDCS